MKLPIGEFHEMTEEECLRLETSFASYDTDGDHGCWLEVDLQYDDHLHDMHSDFPLAPEARKVNVSF